MPRRNNISVDKSVQELLKEKGYSTMQIRNSNGSTIYCLKNPISKEDNENYITTPKLLELLLKEKGDKTNGELHELLDIPEATIIENLKGLNNVKEVPIKSGKRSPPKVLFVHADNYKPEKYANKVEIKIIQFLTKEGPKTAKEISEELKMPRSTAYGYIKSLFNKDIIGKESITDNTVGHPPVHYQLKKK